MTVLEARIDFLSKGEYKNPEQGFRSNSVSEFFNFLNGFDACERKYTCVSSDRRLERRSFIKKYSNSRAWNIPYTVTHFGALEILNPQESAGVLTPIKTNFQNEEETGEQDSPLVESNKYTGMHLTLKNSPFQYLDFEWFKIDKTNKSNELVRKFAFVISVSESYKEKSAECALTWLRDSFFTYLQGKNRWYVTKHSKKYTVD